MITTPTASVSSHPSFAVVGAPSGPRGLRQTLSSSYEPSVAPFRRDGSIPRDNILSVISDHTAAVAVAIRRLDANRVLGCRPPEIHASENTLPRVWRSALSQLRSGFCRYLQSYKAVLKNTDSLCPDCHLEPHTTAYLFMCPSFPSQYEKIDLWANPSNAHFLAFLALLIFRVSLSLLLFFLVL